MVDFTHQGFNKIQCYDLVNPRTPSGTCQGFAQLGNPLQELAIIDPCGQNLTSGSSKYESRCNNKSNLDHRYNPRKRFIFMLRKSSVPKISELDVSINHTGTSLNVSVLDTSTLLYVSIDHTLSMLKVSVAYPKSKQKVILADKKVTLKVSIADTQATLQFSIAFLISHTTTTLLIGNWAGFITIFHNILACYFLKIWANVIPLVEVTQNHIKKMPLEERFCIIDIYFIIQCLLYSSHNSKNLTGNNIYTADKKGFVLKCNYTLCTKENCILTSGSCVSFSCSAILKVLVYRIQKSLKVLIWSLNLFSISFKFWLAKNEFGTNFAAQISLVNYKICGFLSLLNCLFPCLKDKKCLASFKIHIIGEFSTKFVEISTLSFILIACFLILDLTGIIAIKKKSVVCFQINTSLYLCCIFLSCLNSKSSLSCFSFKILLIQFSLQPQLVLLVLRLFI
ncbi:hypothetical protein VP01_1367g2 [Puccinia sorghi]|uniref:Uncharacterized protein n=1 Tax=Puccinia sorghi TaxID=27349 RepID=A0A0L6VLR8_9BASI|nr:hypothetical protein VP01_1367g2 [Puccinia sorghi]